MQPKANNETCLHLNQVTLARIDSAVVLCQKNLTLPDGVLMASLVQPARDAALAIATAIRIAQQEICATDDPLCSKVLRIQLLE